MRKKTRAIFVEFFAWTSQEVEEIRDQAAIGFRVIVLWAKEEDLPRLNDLFRVDDVIALPTAGNPNDILGLWGSHAINVKRSKSYGRSAQFVMLMSDAQVGQSTAAFFAVK